MNVQPRVRDMETVVRNPAGARAAEALFEGHSVSETEPDLQPPLFSRARPTAKPPPGGPDPQGVGKRSFVRCPKDMRRAGPCAHHPASCVALDEAESSGVVPARVAFASEREVLMGLLRSHAQKTQK